MTGKDFELVTALRWEDDSKPEWVAFHGRHVVSDGHPGAWDDWYITEGGNCAVVGSDHILSTFDDPAELLEDDISNFPVYEKLTAAMGQQPTILDI